MWGARRQAGLAVVALGLLLLLGCTSSPDGPGEEFVPAPSTSVAPGGSNPSTEAAGRTSTSTTSRPAPTPSTDAPTSSVKPALELRPDGLGVVGFGAAQAEVLAVVGRAYGDPVPADECPEYVAWRWGGLTAVFHQDRFIAWVVDGETLPPLTTERTVGFGSTIAEVRAAYPEVTVEPSQMDDGTTSYATFADGGDGGLKMWAEFSGNADADTIVLINAWDARIDLPCGRS